MNATKIALGVALVGLCAFVPRSVIADDMAIQALTKRILEQRLLGAPGRVELTYGHVGYLPEPITTPDDTQAVGTVATLATGNNMYGGTTGSDDYTAYFTTTRSPQSIYTALADQLQLAGYQPLRYPPNATGGFKVTPVIGATYCRRDGDPTIFIQASADGNDPHITNAEVHEAMPRPKLSGGTTCMNKTNASGIHPPALPEIVSTDDVIVMTRSIPANGMGTAREDAGIKTTLALSDALESLAGQLIAAGWKRDDRTSTARVGIATFSKQSNGRGAVVQLMISRLTSNTMFAQLQSMWVDAQGYAP